MSAHLQFGPEWMRKGAPSGKTPTTPTPSSESPFVFSDSPQGAKSSTSSSAGRKNAPKDPIPVPVSPSSGPLPSPGGFSFAAAAASGGAGSGSNTQQSSTFASNGTVFPSNLDGDGSRYSKRLLSLYSTEHGPKGIPSEPSTTSSERAPPTGPASFSGLSNRKKGFVERDSAVGSGGGGNGGGGRRSHSINTDVANVYKDRSDSQRTGLFQRGNPSSNNLGPSATNNHPHTSQQHPIRDRHVSGGGILGGVLAGVAPNSSRKNGGQLEDHQENDIKAAKRERLPGEGPIGPPTDRNGGFVKGFTTDRRRTNGPVPNPTKRSAPSPSIAADPEPVKESSGLQSTDVDLSHHAATLVESLKLDEDDEDVLVNKTESINDSDWSPDQAEWFYRDPSGQVQGPFKANVMQEWYTAKYFNDDLLVRPAEATEFIPLGIMLRLIGDTIKPFLVAPSLYAAAKPSQPAPVPVPAPSSPMNLLAPGSNNQNWHTQTQQSPFLVNPTLAGLANQGVPSSPFGTPSSPFLDLNASNSHQQQQHAEFLMYQQRAMQEQRNAQMAALAMAQRSGDPSMMAAAAWNNASQSQPPQAWGQSLPPQQAFSPESGWANTIPPPPPQQQQQQHHHHQQQHQQHQQQQFNQQSLFDAHQQELQMRDEQPVAARDAIESVQNADLVEPSLGGKESSEKSMPKPVETEKLADEVAESVQQRKAEEVEQETSPAHLWPQSPSAVEFAPEATPEEVTPVSMTTVKGRKARRGEKVSQGGNIPLREDEDGNDIQNAATGSIKVMNESDFRKHQASLRGQEKGNSIGSDSLTKNAAQSAGTSATAKAAPWAGNASSNGMSLRDIQDAEEKRVEALRTRQQRPVAGVRGDSISTPTSMNKMTWGLASVPSSANNNTGNASVSSPTAATGPVWNSSTNAKTGTPKKTLTEIQEEERKRTQAATAVSRSVNPAGSQVPARGGRGYADLASTNTSIPNSSVGDDTGSEWAVVGAGGSKPSAAAPVSHSTRPVPVVASSVPKTPMVRSTSSTASPSTASGQQIQPSGDLLRYCREQLKGLQIKVDDFIEMLLSFPLDPSPDVVEIIAESVYANSATLDGRRFAADFVAKRKQDAILQRRKGASATSGPTNNMNANIVSGGTTTSVSDNTSSPLRNASDVLKQPARSMNSNVVGGSDAFGGFKVVKPKGGKKRV